RVPGDAPCACHTAAMKKALVAAAMLPCLMSAAFGRGVSPYLPLNLDPEMEAQVERLLLLADKPILTRPIAAATVLDALPSACRVDKKFCDEARRYLARYTHESGATSASLEIAGSSGPRTSLPNRHGETTDSSWQASVSGYYQPGDYALVSLGAIAD